MTRPGEFPLKGIRYQDGYLLNNPGEVGVSEDGCAVLTHPNPQLLRRYMKTPLKKGQMGTVCCAPASRAHNIQYPLHPFFRAIMTLLKKGVLHLDGGARIPFHTHFRAEFPEYGPFPALKWSISPIDSVISEFFQRSQS